MILQECLRTLPDEELRIALNHLGQLKRQYLDIYRAYMRLSRLSRFLLKLKHNDVEFLKLTHKHILMLEKEIRVITDYLIDKDIRECVDN